MGGGAQSNDRPQIDPRNTHIAGLILKELFVPQADNGLKTCHIRFRCLIALNWQEANAHELAYSLGELVRIHFGYPLVFRGVYCFVYSVCICRFLV